MTQWLATLNTPGEVWVLTASQAGVVGRAVDPKF